MPAPARACSLSPSPKRPSVSHTHKRAACAGAHVPVPPPSRHPSLARVIRVIRVIRVAAVIRVRLALRLSTASANRPAGCSGRLGRPVSQPAAPPRSNMPTQQRSAACAPPPPARADAVDLITDHRPVSALSAAGRAAGARPVRAGSPGRESGRGAACCVSVVAVRARRRMLCLCGRKPGPESPAPLGGAASGSRIAGARFFNAQIKKGSARTRPAATKRPSSAESRLAAGLHCLWDLREILPSTPRSATLSPTLRAAQRGRPARPFRGRQRAACERCSAAAFDSVFQSPRPAHNLYGRWHVGRI